MSPAAPAPESPDDLLSFDEVATTLRVGRKRIAEWVAAGTIAAEPAPGPGDNLYPNRPPARKIRRAELAKVQEWTKADPDAAPVRVRSGWHAKAADPGRPKVNAPRSSKR